MSHWRSKVLIVWVRFDYVIHYRIFVFRDNYSDLRVRVGSQINTEGGSLHNVSAIIYHADFDFEKLSTDVAVIKVRNSIVVLSILIVHYDMLY